MLMPSPHNPQIYLTLLSETQLYHNPGTTHTNNFVSRYGRVRWVWEGNLGNQAKEFGLNVTQTYCNLKDIMLNLHKTYTTPLPFSSER